ncbi:MAG: substrate-binding domain-containing protein [Spirochaetales bacterium]|nr:substrate-binding domain-containing protein [Spirochaetales bacterium]
MKNKIPTIGFFSPRLDAYYQTVLWNGIREKANEFKVKLICFPGERVGAEENFEYQANSIYKLACKENVDGIIILTLAIGTFLTKKALKDFCLSYSPIPLVSVGLSLPGVPSVTIDHSNGMKQLIHHLVTFHHYKRFAFIGGGENQREFEIRLRVLQKELKKYGITLDNDLIVSGDSIHDSGMEVIDLFRKKRKKNFDVIVAANDNIAIGALESFRNKGIRVPDEIAVVGYDDISSSNFCTPPLTTVYQPVYELGCKALEMVLDIVYHIPVSEKIVLPTKIVIRESCGCFQHETDFKGKMAIIRENKSLHDAFPVFKDTIIEEYKKIMTKPLYLKKKNLEIKQLSELVDTFYNDLINHLECQFISFLNKLLRNSVTTRHDIIFFGRIITLLRDTTLKYNIQKEELIRAEYLWEQARVLISEISQRLQSFKRMEAGRLSRRLWEVGNALITSFDIGKLIDVIIESIIKLKITRCYFSVFEQYLWKKYNRASMYVEECSTQSTSNCSLIKRGSDFPGWTRLLLAYNRGKIRKLPGQGIRFQSKLLLPSHIFPKGNIGPLIVEPLYFRFEQLGLIIFEMSNIENTIYDALRQQLSSALKGAFLMQEIKNHAQLLTKEVTERTADLTKANKQLQREILRRKKVDAALKESEKNLRTITEATPLPLVIIRMRDGRIQYSNNPFLYEFGLYSSGHKGKVILNRRIHQFFHDFDYINEIFEKLEKTGKLANIELTASRQDGTTFSVISSFQTLKFRGEKSVLAGFYNITERKRLEKEILEISGREQRRIGQDLHDDLCQNMAGIAVMVSALENNLKNTDSITAEKAAVISQLINETIVKTRSLARGLYPAALEENGLAYMLQELSKKIQNQFDINCKLRIKNKEPVEDNSIALHLYRIGQEAINNAIRHGKPDFIEISFTATEDEIELVIRDNGIGIPENYTHSKGMGLQIMNYRANMIGGKLDIRRNERKGTCLSCIIKRKK